MANACNLLIINGYPAIIIGGEAYMPISELALLQTWEKVEGRCQCQRWSHNHTYVRCNRRLTWENRGANAEGGWIPRYRTSPTTDILLDCEILCWDCYQRALADEMQSLQ